MNGKRFLIITIPVIVVILAAIAAVTFFFDPLFHYRSPRPGYYYDLYEKYERLQNDGIQRHFSYDAIVTGSSMCQNFKTTEADELFGVKSIKTCYSGGTLREVEDALGNSFSYNPGIKVVIRGIDYEMLLWDKDKLEYDLSAYPLYIRKGPGYDDIGYLLSKTVLYDYTVNMIDRKLAGEPGGVKPLDDYASFTSDVVETTGYGINAFRELYGSLEYNGPGEEQPLSEEDVQNVRSSAENNIISIARNNPGTQFYYFFTPYSIYRWMAYSEEGNINRMIDAEQVMIEEILKCDNIRLYSFNDREELVCDLNNYSDKMHYSDQINSMILRDMKSGKGLLTKDNYMDYISREKALYNGFDYASIDLIK